MSNQKNRAWILGLAGAALASVMAATFATWTDEVHLDRERIALGELAVHAGELAWTDVSPDVEERDISLDDFLLSPGDHLLGVGEVHAHLVGHTLRAELQIPGREGIPGWVRSDVWFLDPVTGERSELAVTERSATATVVVRIELPRDTAGRMSDRVDLSDLRVLLRQVL